MELTKMHREVLLVKLEELEKSLESAKSKLLISYKDDRLTKIIPLEEIEVFVIRENIEVVKRSLIENQIDFELWQRISKGHFLSFLK